MYREPDHTGALEDEQPAIKMSLEVNEGLTGVPGAEIRSKDDKFNKDIDVATEAPKGPGSIAERLERAKQFENMKKEDKPN